MVDSVTAQFMPAESLGVECGKLQRERMIYNALTEHSRFTKSFQGETPSLGPDLNTHIAFRQVSFRGGERKENVNILNYTLLADVI